jgi:hypothetical protein
MGRSVAVVGSAVALAVCLASSAGADVTLQAQERSIAAATTSDGNVQTANASDFAPFVQTLNVSTTFVGPSGPVSNVAISRIDCQIDPNSIRARGNLAGAGGVLASTGEVETGDAKASVLITFQVNSPIEFSLMAIVRPEMHPTDSFTVEIKDITRNNRVFVLDSDDPPQMVNTSGTLQPGQYWMKYRIEMTFDGPPTSNDFGFNLTLGCRADYNGHDGLSAQDIFDFLGAWFAVDQRADFDGSGMVAPQDILEYLNAWFAGCP